MHIGTEEFHTLGDLDMMKLTIQKASRFRHCLILKPAKKPYLSIIGNRMSRFGSANTDTGSHCNCHALADLKHGRTSLTLQRKLFEGITAVLQ